MNQIHFINSFNKGQVTIPKSVRSKLGLGDVFWLKLTAYPDKIVLEPALSKTDKTSYLNKLLSISGDWIDTKDWKNIRQEIASHLTSNDPS